MYPNAVIINAGTPEQVAKDIADRLFTEITVGGGQGLKKQFSDPEKYKAKYLEVYAECLRVVKNPDGMKTPATVSSNRKAQLDAAA